ncbi:MAG: DUF1273 domain-containing protein [Oscillospiraceae bacterium]|nr:DUF1273 domain-containing protein [Oscillospiraceae bacterium]
MSVIEKTACFTGHRPEKLSSDSYKLNLIKQMLRNAAFDAAVRGYTTFFTGMQRGTDLWAAKTVFELTDRFPVEVVAVYPFRDIGKSYKGEDAELFEEIQKKAADTIIISESYYGGCYSARNKYMVEHSSHIIAIVEDYNSGTGQTIAYAKKRGLSTDIIDLKKTFYDLADGSNDIPEQLTF